MKRPIVVAVLALLIGLVLGTLIGAPLGASLSPLFARSEPARPPNLAGQPVPDTFLAIDFTRRHDLHCSDRTYRHCKILGFTGRKENAAAGGGTSLSGSSGFREYFDNWLVLEMEDGRLAYVPPHSVSAFESSAP